MEGTRKRKRKETFRPPRNVRKYLDRQSEPLPTVQFRAVPDTAALGAMGTKDCWQMASPAHRKLCTFPNHFPGTRKRKKIRERKEGKENVP